MPLWMHIKRWGWCALVVGLLCGLMHCSAGSAGSGGSISNDGGGDAAPAGGGGGGVIVPIELPSSEHNVFDSGSFDGATFE